MIRVFHRRDRQPACHPGRAAPGALRRGRKTPGKGKPKKTKTKRPNNQPQPHHNPQPEKQNFALTRPASDIGDPLVAFRRLAYHRRLNPAGKSTCPRNSRRRPTWPRNRSPSPGCPNNAYAFTAEGDPNSGVIIGDDGVMVVDTQATPVMAQEVIKRIRQVTDKPIKYAVLSHYHAVRVLGASASPGDDHREQGDLRTHPRARRAGLEVRVRALPAPVPGRRFGARADLAAHRVRKRDHRLDGQARSPHHPCRSRPHAGRHDRVAARAENPVQRRPGRIQRRRLLR